MRLIDLDSLIVEFKKRCRGECCCCTEDYCGSGNDGCGCRVIDDAPTVDAEPVKHGHWIECDFGLICSECNHYTETMYDEPFNNEFGKGWALKRPYYCGYCGARMDEVAE